MKTRLAAALGAEAAAQLYREWIGLVLRQVQPVRPAIRVIAYYDSPGAVRCADWDALVDLWWAQPPGDLGWRLDEGFRRCNRAGPMLAIGTDCLEINSRHIETAVRALADYDAVFGPARDGGYYLVGTARYVPEFFAGIRWSTPQTLADQLQRCQTLGLRSTLLEVLRDIDTLADWQEYQRRGEARP